MRTHAVTAIRSPGIVCWRCLRCYQHLNSIYHAKEYYLFGLVISVRGGAIFAYLCSPCQD